MSRLALLGRCGLPLLAPPLAPPPALHLSFWQVKRAALRRALAYIPRCLTRQMWLPPPQRAPPLALSLLASPALVGQVRGSRCCAPSFASHLALLGRCGRRRRRVRLRLRLRPRSRFRRSHHLPHLAGWRVALSRTSIYVPLCLTRQAWSPPPPCTPPLYSRCSHLFPTQV